MTCNNFYYKVLVSKESLTILVACHLKSFYYTLITGWNGWSFNRDEGSDHILFTY